MISPTPFRWDGTGMMPLRPRAADKVFVVGATYTFVEHQQRSSASHAHFFAVVHDAWLNLPEDIADRFPSEDHLRRYALVRAGLCTHREVVCATKAEARRWSVEATRLCEFAVVEVKDAVVTIYEAKSQSMRAMDKRTFDESKQKVFDVLASMIGTDPTTLRTQAARAA